jgi:hypothetical protein
MTIKPEVLAILLAWVLLTTTVFVTCGTPERACITTVHAAPDCIRALRGEPK